MKKILLICSAMIMLYACVSTPNPTVDVQDSPAIVIYDVAKQSYLYAEPTTASKKLINQRATEVLREVQYLSIDNSCKVMILESQNEWSKICVYEPEWLRSSHIGWVKTNVLITPNTNVTSETFYENKDYQILYKKNIGVTKNIRVLILKPFSKDQLAKLAKQIRNKEPYGDKCNVSIYDSKSIVPLIEKYPLSKQDYVKLADHFIYELYFDNTSVYYPLVDIQYKEYGGKKPIQ